MAVSHQEPERDGEFSGTVNYAAPEVLWRGRRAVPADSYAAAATLVELFTETKTTTPWAMRGAFEWKSALRVQLSPAHCDLLEAMLAADPTRRPSARDVL